MIKPLTTIASFASGLMIGLICNVHVLALSSTLGTAPTGRAWDAAPTAAIAAVFTAAGLLFNRWSFDSPLNLVKFSVPYLLGTAVFPSVAFGHPLAGLLTMMIIAVPLLADTLWQRKAAGSPRR